MGNKKSAGGAFLLPVDEGFRRECIGYMALALCAVALLHGGCSFDTCDRAWWAVSAQDIYMLKDQVLRIAMPGICQDKR